MIHGWVRTLPGRARPFCTNNLWLFELIGISFCFYKNLLASSFFMLLWSPFAIQSCLPAFCGSRDLFLPSCLALIFGFLLINIFSYACLKGISRFVWERLSGCGHLLLGGISPGSLFFLHLWAASEKDGVRICSAWNWPLRFLLSSSQHLANSCVSGLLSKPSCPAHDHAWTLSEGLGESLMRLVTELLRILNVMPTLL